MLGVSIELEPLLLASFRFLMAVKALAPEHLAFEKYTGLSIQESIGKIPKWIWFYAKCNEIMAEIDSELLATASTKLVDAMCGSGYRRHTAYQLTIKINSRTLRIGSHSDANGNIELDYTAKNKVWYSSCPITDWSCMQSERSICKSDAIKKPFRDLLDLFLKEIKA